jgi:hypothetical protein
MTLPILRHQLIVGVPVLGGPENDRLKWRQVAFSTFSMGIIEVKSFFTINYGMIVYKLYITLIYEPLTAILLFIECRRFALIAYAQI